MLDRKWLLENLQTALAARPGTDINADAIRNLSAKRVSLIGDADALRNERKTISSEIGARKKAGEDTSEIQARVRSMAEEIGELEAELEGVEAELDDLLARIPNLPLADVPLGADESENVEVRRVGEIDEDGEGKLPHWDLGEQTGTIDLERAGKVAGSRFAYMLGPAARLEMVLANWMMRVHADDGYREVIPPYLVRDSAMFGTGQLPKFADDAFQTTDDRYLIPTAEVPVTNLFADEILSPDDLPAKFVAFSPCFRAEAGAAGRDTRGIIRVHQFHKVELVHFEFPENSEEALEQLTAQAEKILQLLELPYRVVKLCTGDLGFSAAKTYDLEVWLPGQQRWLEISSCSTFTDFQARRANVRYRPAADLKPAFVHTLNGSGLALGRTIVALYENYQNPNGTITVPDILREPLGIDTIKG